MATLTYDRLWNIWLIDDHIELNLLVEPRRATFREKGMPIRSNVLQELLDASDAGGANWEEPRVYDLVSEVLARPDVTVTGFLHPTNAISALKAGERPPDLLIYDWEYVGASDAENVQFLSTLLESGFPFVCVYTHKQPEDIFSRLAEVRSKYPTQFLGVKSKEDVASAELITEAQQRIRTTVAGDITLRIRPTMDTAMGRALREFSLIPSDVFVPAPSKAMETEGPEELAAILSEIMSGEVAAATMADPSDQVDAILHCIEQIVGQSVRDSGDIKQLFAAIVSTVQNRQQDGVQVTPTERAAGLRRLQAYQLYTSHSTDRVLSGDILQLTPNLLVLVLTAPCHLERFSTKTRNCLTYLRLYRCNVDGWKVMTEGLASDFVVSNSNFEKANSITAQWKVSTELPLVLPSVPDSSVTDGFADLYTLPDRLGYLRINQQLCGYGDSAPLRIGNLAKQFKDLKRLGTLSESYFGPLKWAIVRHVFASGARDFLPTEVQRLKDLFKSHFGTKKG